MYQGIEAFSNFNHSLVVTKQFMPKFDLKRMYAIKGAQEFYQLTIDDKPDLIGAHTDKEKNERKTGELDKFIKNLEVKYEKNIKMIFAYMDFVANNIPVSGVKYHELKRPASDPVKDFEFKHGDLRVYAFKIPNGKIIAIAGYKNTQPQDIL